jgi:cell division protein FtsW
MNQLTEYRPLDFTHYSLLITHYFFGGGETVKPFKRPPDLVLFLDIVLLLTIGIIMVFSSSFVQAQTSYGDGFYFLKRQLLWALLGIFGMIALMRVDYQVYKKWATPILLVAVLLLIVVLVPGVGIKINGARRWLGTAAFSFQPSEVAKLALVLFLARYLSQHQDSIKQFVKGFAVPLLFVVFICGFMLLQPDLGTAVTVALTSYLMLLAAGARKTHLVGLALLGVVVLGVAIAVAPYRLTRFTAFLNPWADPLGSGFQTIQSLYAVGSGKLFGLGLGMGRQKFLYLPEVQTDFIFAVIGEELGFIGSAFVLLLFFVFMWRGLKIALKVPDTFASLTAVGITMDVVLQAFIHIGVVTGSMPVKGITLPFISYGGSSLTLTLLMIGILLNISHYAEE